MCNSSNLVPQISKIRRYAPQVIAVSVKNVLLLVYGLTMGMPTMLIPNLSGNVEGENIVLDDDGISWIGSINYLSVPLGCLVSGGITRPLGRIRSMQIICVLFFATFILYHFASEAWHLFVALFLTGFAGGLLEAPTLIYTVEVTESSLRGAMCSTSTLAIAIGVIISFILGTIFQWRTMALINACLPLAGLLAMFLIPESPYWLVTQNKLEKAKKSLAWLRGWTGIKQIEEEFQKIVNEWELMRSSKKWFHVHSLKLYAKATFIKPYLLICLTIVLAHFGTTQINIYAVKMFQVLQVPIDSYYATILIGTAELIGSILLMLLVRWLGKRVLIFIAQLGIAMGFLFVGVYTYELGVKNLDATDALDTKIAETYNWVPLVSIVAIGFFSYLMTYTLPWIIMGELYPNDIRDISSGLSAGSGYIIGFLANKTFLNLVHLSTLAGVFWVYSVVAILGLIAMYFLMPETEGKGLFEITEHYAGRGKLNNKVGGRKQTIRNGLVTGISNEAFENGDYKECDTKV